MIPRRYIRLVSSRSGSRWPAPQLRALTPTERRQYARAMFDILNTERYANNLDTRIAAIEVLLALPRESAPLLRKLVRNVSTPTSYEVLFTLFLSLYSGAPRFKRFYIRLVESFLMGVRTNTGSAAFEAAHYLGSSCRDWSGVQSLFRVALKGRTVVGRVEAVQALSYPLRLQPLKRRREIIAFLRARAEDSNPEVHWQARSTLKSAVGTAKD